MNNTVYNLMNFYGKGNRATFEGESLDLIKYDDFYQLIKMCGLWDFWDGLEYITERIIKSEFDVEGDEYWKYYTQFPINDPKKGKLLRRIAKAIKRIYEKQLTNESLGIMGDKLKEILSTKMEFTFDFTNRFNWNSGDFGDGGSCYWGCYNGARKALQESGICIAMRFYDNCGEGEGRVWIANHPHIDNAVIMFNVYPRTNSKYSYKSVAHTLKLALEKANDMEYVVSPSLPMNNNCGLLYINNNQGICLYPKESELLFNPERNLYLDSDYVYGQNEDESDYDNDYEYEEEDEFEILDEAY